jgi:peptidoglycan/LPS O-acetylase OafA/YrhL
MESIHKEKIFFPNLDGLRFIAFAFVFSEHILWGPIKFLNIKNPLLHDTLYTLFCGGGLGVSIFFVLSGFLITYLILREIDRNGRINVNDFYIRRFLRIWPLYYAVLIFVFLVYPYIQSLFSIHVNVGSRPVFYWFFLSNFDLIHLGQFHLPGSLLSGVTWSVAIEEQFYLLWPLLFFFIPKRYFLYIYFPFIIGSLIFRSFYLDDPYQLYFNSLSVCSDLAIGGLSAYLILNNMKFKRFFELTTFRARVVIYIAGIIYLLFSDYYFNFHAFVLFKRLISSLFFVWIILDQNFNLGREMKLSKYKFMSYWGKYTYGLYLLHPIAFLLVTTVVKHYDINDDSFLRGMVKALITAILTFALSYFSYNWFEKYFLKLKEKFAYFVKE